MAILRLTPAIRWRESSYFKWRRISNFGRAPSAMHEREPVGAVNSGRMGRPNLARPRRANQGRPLGALLPGGKRISARPRLIKVAPVYVDAIKRTGTTERDDRALQSSRERP